MAQQNDSEWRPKIVAFLCNWCSYAGADLAGVSRMQYPPDIRIIRVPCSGRINPLYILSALHRGADGVLVSGCHPGDCHYISGNLVARRKFAMLKEFLQHVGIEPERVHFSWVSASEGARFAILIAVPCTGVIDAAGVARSVQPDEIIAAEENDGMLLIKSDAGTTRKLKRTEALAEACRLCTHRTASVYDIAVGEPPETECVAASDDRFRQFTSKPGSERWKLFCREVSKCTLCKACRSACPNCYCKTCFADQTRPNWAGTGDQLRDVMLFHLGRIFHQAGRCVDCGACVRACNMGVDLRMFTYKLVADAKELFDCTAGVDLEQPPPLAAFSAGDPERFITEPE